MVTKSLYNEVRRLEIETNRLINSTLAGEYLSAFKGRGVEFESVRPYVEGDEIRFIDWNVSAKLNQLFVKRYQEERELSIMILVDVSGSMFFGSSGFTKRELTIRLAALLSMVAMKNQDRVGLILFDSKVRKLIMPRKGRKHSLTLIRDLLAYEAQKKATNLSLSLKLINQILKKKSVVFIISDFADANYHQSFKLAARKHDLVPIVVGDPLEYNWQNKLLVRLEDLETGQSKVIFTGDPAWAKYQKQQQIRKECLLTDFRKCSVEPIFISTDRPYLPLLMRYFKKRSSRRMH